MNAPARLAAALPELAEEVRALLEKRGLPELAASVAELPLVDRCRCGDHFCATVFTRAKPSGAWKAGFENLILVPRSGMIILDVVEGRIACIEVLYRNDVRARVMEVMP